MTTIDETRAHAELCDRLDHMRRVADARARVHAFIGAFADHEDTRELLTVATRASGHRDVTLALGDLRILLDAEFTPTRDEKRDDDDDDETGLHRQQALAQLGGGSQPSPRGWDRV